MVNEKCNKSLPLGVLISGRGSNLRAIIENIENHSLSAVVSVVVSSNEHAPGLEMARNKGIPTFFVGRKSFDSKDNYERKIISILREHGVNLVILAGYMQIVGKVILKEYPNNVFNIHPSLLPSFPGLDVQKKALEYGVKFSGCTVHFVDEGMDTGPIILQAVVPVEDNDTVEVLSERILNKEHIIYSQAIQLIAEGRVKIKGRRVLIESQGK